MVEIHCEILEEIAFVRIVAVTKHPFVFEMMSVVLQFVFYELEIRIEFVLFVSRGIVQIAVAGHNGVSPC
jgi:hypothetical protein